MTATPILKNANSTEIKRLDKSAIYQVVRHNASLADAIKQVVSKAIDDGEIDERQLETVLALSTLVSEELDRLSLAIHELQEKK